MGPDYFDKNEIRYLEFYDTWESCVNLIQKNILK